MRLPPLSTVANLLVATVAVASLLHLVRPIDIQFDSICYLLQAQRIVGIDAATGWSFEPVCYYPPGYPAMLAVFLRLGVAMSAASVLLNLACMALGLVFIQKAAALVMNMPRSWSIWPLLASINSFVFVRAVTPLHSEPLFLLTQSLALLFLARVSARAGTRRTDMLLAVAAIICAMQTRTVGVALLGALCWVGWRELSGLPPHVRRRMTILMATLVAVGMTATLYFRGYYLTTDLGSTYRGEILATFGKSLLRHFRELGEIVMNIPPSRIPERLRFPFVVVGGLVSVAGLRLLWVRRHRWTVFETYLIAYSAIIFIWPFYDTRFWYPVIPVVSFIVVDEIRVRGLLASRRVRLAVAGYGLYFLATGAVAHAFNIRRSLNPDWVVQQYESVTDDQSIHAGLGHSTSTQVDSSVVRMLKVIRP